LIATTTGTLNRRTILDLLGQVRATRSHRLDVLLEQRRVERLAGHDPADAAVHLQRADGRDDDAASGRSPTPALDVEELLGTHVGAETGLGADDLVRCERKAVRDDRVVPVGDVRERSAVARTPARPRASAAGSA
jgi:hypothetical protein